MKLRYTPAAICDLQEIKGYIRDTLQNPGAATNTVARIARDVAILKEQPHLGPELRKKLNREIDSHYLITGKYIVIYDIDDVISVLRVLDTRTNYLKALFGDESLLRSRR